MLNVENNLGYRIRMGNDVNVMTRGDPILFIDCNCNLKNGVLLIVIKKVYCAIHFWYNGYWCTIRTYDSVDAWFK
jgi:hypothetical protein